MSDYVHSRHDVRVYVLQKSVFGSLIAAEKYDADSLKDIAKWIMEIRCSVPEAYRDTLKLGIDSVGGYEGEHHVEIEIYYDRPETDGEMTERIAAAEREAISKEIAERKQYEVLKRKFAAQ